MIKTKQVESSWVDKVSYNTKDRILWVLTKDGQSYMLDRVSPRVFTLIVNAPSVGYEVSNLMKNRLFYEYKNRGV